MTHTRKQHIRPGKNDRLRRGSAADLVAAILNRLFSEQTGPVLIAVGGPGGTGKSTFARRLADRLKEATVLKLDNYKTSRVERAATNRFGPHPDANRMELVAEHLAALRGGRTVTAPVYDRDTGEANHTQRVPPARWVVVDGEISTYARFRDLIDFSIFIDSDWRTQLATRLGRDLAARGYSPDKAVATFLHSNLREFAEHGAASKQWADLHLFCHDDYRLELESIAQSLYDDVREALRGGVVPVNAEGLIVPILTPFDDGGEIATRVFVDHLDWLAETGVRRILVGGEAGEGFSLAAVEKLTLLKLALEYFPGLVLFHAGGDALPDVLQLAEQAERLGADGIVCAAPRRRPGDTREGVVEYLSRVVSATDLPLFLEFSAPLADPEMVAEIPPLIPHSGIIDSAGNVARLDEGSRRFIGDEAFTPDTPVGEYAGIVSAAANVLPALFLQLERCQQTGGDGGERLESRIGDLVRCLGSGKTAAIKHLLNARLGHYPTAVRPPLTRLENAAAHALCATMPIRLCGFSLIIGPSRTSGIKIIRLNLDHFDCELE